MPPADAELAESTAKRAISPNLFNPVQLPYRDQRKSRRVAVVTGANSGIGYYVSLHLYLHGWVVYMACRSYEKCQDAIKRIYSEYEGRRTGLPSTAVPGWLEYVALDLTDLESIRACAETLLVKEDTIDLLVNNAGVMGLPAENTADGYDIQTMTNHIGPYMFTRMLVPSINKSVHGPRIVFLSSIGHYMATPEVNLAKKHHMRPNIVFTWFRYGNSKTANIHTAKILSELYPNITTIAVHPGFSLFTGLLEYWTELQLVGPFFDLFFQAFMAVFGVSQEEAAFAPLRAALSPSISHRDSGKYLVTYGEEGRTSRKAANLAMAWKTWNWTERQLKNKGYHYI